MAYIPPNPNGQATKANSAPVVFASDQDALPLSTGAATSAKQDTGNTSLASIDGKITAVNTGAVVISSSALPSGAATGAKQDTGNTSLGNIDTSTAAVNTVLGAKADAKSTATDTTAVSIVSILKQISASVQAPPSQAVTNAGTFAVQATLAAETTKVIGTVRTADGSGNLYTSNSTTYTAKFGQDSNLLGTLGTAFSTAGKVDVKGADGDVFVRQATASNLKGIMQESDGSGNVRTYNSTTTTSKFGADANILSLAGTLVDTNSGNKSAGTLRVVLATDQPQLTNKLLVTPDANSSVNISQMNGVAVTMGNGTSGTGVQRVTIASDSTGQVALAAGSALVGKVGIDQTTPGTTNAVVDTPVTSGGLSIKSASTGGTATSIKASAGQLYGYHLFNTTAAVAYVQIFNVASGSVTLGTTTPDISIGIPASGGVTVNFDKGIAFGTAISYACTTTRTGSTGATVDCNFFYK